MQMFDKPIKSEKALSKKKEQNLPTSIIKVDHREWDDEPLLKLEGELPDNMCGYVFIAAPLRSKQDYLASKPKKEMDHSIFNGDGMIYRLEFKEGETKLKARIAATPCYYIDKATFGRKHGFKDSGLARIGSLGIRNQLNTAFLPFKNRLLVTFDAGRPYEIDPNTLELLQPVGSVEQWRKAAPSVSLFSKEPVFKTYLSPAHPVYDSSTDEIFTANYAAVSKNFLLRLFDKIIRYKPFTDLIRWNGGNGIERWNLELQSASPNKKNEPLYIKQSLHQLAITKNYLIFADIAFVNELSKVLIPSLFNFLPDFVKRCFTRPLKQNPDTNLFIINRKDLKKGSVTLEDPKKLIAKKVVIPREIGHFVTDYEDSLGKITLHATHNCAWDVTEWLRKGDKPAFDKRLRKDLLGMMVGPMDVSCLGRYVIDVENGNINSTIHWDPQSTWAVSVYTHPNFDLSNRIKNIYWLSWGFSPSLIPRKIYKLYKDYKYRTIPIKSIHKQGDQPIKLLRLNTESMKIVDVFDFPLEVFAASPQFVPKTDTQKGKSSENCPQHETPIKNIDQSIDGYIVCVVLSDDPKEQSSGDEFWIFDAKNLSNGPICKLGHRDLDLGFTLHSTWLPKLNTREPNEAKSIRRHSVWNDYHNLVKEREDKNLMALFEKMFLQYEEQEKITSKQNLD